HPTEKRTPRHHNAKSPTRPPTERLRCKHFVYQKTGNSGNWMRWQFRFDALASNSITFPDDVQLGLLIPLLLNGDAYASCARGRPVIDRLPAPQAGFPFPIHRRANGSTFIRAKCPLAGISHRRLRNDLVMRSIAARDRVNVSPLLSAHQLRIP